MTTPFAYLIVEIDVRDPDRYRQYIEAVPAVVAKFGGEYLVRGGRTETLEGKWLPKRIAVLRFPNFARAKEWWDSDDYRALRELRQATTITDMILAEGIG